MGVDGQLREWVVSNSEDLMDTTQRLIGAHDRYINLLGDTTTARRAER